MLLNGCQAYRSFISALNHFNIHLTQLGSRKKIAYSPPPSLSQEIRCYAQGAFCRYAFPLNNTFPVFQLWTCPLLIVWLEGKFDFALLSGSGRSIDFWHFHKENIVAKTFLVSDESCTNFVFYALPRHSSLISTISFPPKNADWMKRLTCL